MGTQKSHKLRVKGPNSASEPQVSDSFYKVHSVYLRRTLLSNFPWEKTYNY